MKQKSSIVWIVVVVVLAVVLIATWGLAAKTSTDNFCVTCHAYEKVSWDHGQHPDIGCIACHTKGVIKDKTAGMRKVYLTLTDQVDPHRDNLPSYLEKTHENCVACHMTKEITDMLPFFKARHDEYLKVTPTCMGCHDAGHTLKLKDLRKEGSRLRI
jgi:cytochrome c nitrite reductase small subunit